MFSHADIWQGIDRLAQSCGYSPSGLARKAGLDPTSFNKSKRVSPDGKPRWPSTESLSKILAVTGATMSDFITMIDADTPGGDSKTQTIPVIGFAQAGEDGYFDEDGYPAGDGWDYLDFPDPGLKNAEHVFALKVNGDSMQPLYRKDDTLVVSPTAKLRNGDRLIVRTKEGEVLAKELTRRRASEIELKSLNPAYEDRVLKTQDITWTARILWVSQ